MHLNIPKAGQWHDKVTTIQCCDKDTLCARRELQREGHNCDTGMLNRLGVVNVGTLQPLIWVETFTTTISYTANLHLEAYIQK
jgi:hypothetical protein